MAEKFDATLARIRAVAGEALKHPGTPEAVVQALKEILSLAGPQRGDTPEASDLPHTENQTL